MIPSCESWAWCFAWYTSRVAIYSFDSFLSQFWTSPLFHVWFCCFLTCIQISQKAGKVVWYFHPFNNFPQFVVTHTVKGFSIVNDAGGDVFLEFSCFLYDPTDVGNLISCSSAFSKSRLYIWNFLVHVLLKPSLKDIEHYFASMWNEGNFSVIWTFFGIALLWDWNENWPFLVLCPLLSFPNLLAYWVKHILLFPVLKEPKVIKILQAWYSTVHEPRTSRCSSWI